MDFSWFSTIPGMLITGGVLLLIIALIIFIATSGKKNKNEKNDINKKSEEGAKAMVDSTMNDGSLQNAVPDMGNMGINNVPTPPIAEPMAMDTSMQSGMNVVPQTSSVVEQPAMDVPQAVPMVEQPSMDIPQAAPVVEQPTMDVPQAVPMVEQPTMDVPQVAPMVEQPAMDVPQVAPVVEQPTMDVPQVAPVVEQPTMDVPQVAPVVEQSVTPTEPVSIYGGVSQVIPDINLNEEKHEIYGGANPLENTQSISLNDINQVASDTIANSTTPVSPVVDIPVAQQTSGISVEPVQATAPVTDINNV